MHLDCNLCPRLVEKRHNERVLNPDWHNAPVPSFGKVTAQILIVGLAPGRCGANKTGRPFTGDGAGDILYQALLDTNLASGNYAKHAADGLVLHNVRITNAVRCLPPDNKPTSTEIKTCNSFLQDEIQSMPDLKIIIAIGSVAHYAILQTFGMKKNGNEFTHGCKILINNNVTLLSSYHCSRYNISTKLLDYSKFLSIIKTAHNLCT